MVFYLLPFVALCGRRLPSAVQEVSRPGHVTTHSSFMTLKHIKEDNK